MLTRLLLLTSVLGGGLVFLSGAWPGPFTPPSQNANSGFVPQTFSIDPAIIGSGIHANELLQKALEKLDPNRTTWLRTKIRQTMSDPESRFTAEGFLQRGPNHCAHLEMVIDTNGSKARLLVVSDGTTIASVREVVGTEPTATVHAFPESSDPSVKAEFLRSMNCNGPTASLRDVLAQLRDAKLQTGMLHDRRVIQIAGEFGSATASIAVRSCQVYLDAETLWPCRIEWFGVDAGNRVVPIMRVEYLDPEINQELSLAECAKLFSYQP